MIESFGLPRRMLAVLVPERVRSYLLSKMWVEDLDEAYDQAGLFHTETGVGAEVILPNDPKLGDFVGLMSELVKAVGVIENRVPWDVLNELLAPEGDLFRFRLISPFAANGLIPLTAGLRLINNGKESLVAAACSAHVKQPSYYSKGFKEVTDFIDTCVLGQTEIGSFVVPITVPISSGIQYDQQKLVFRSDDANQVGLDYEPFARRVSLTFMKGLSALEEAAKTRRYEQFMTDLPDGVSANLCEALSEMRPPGMSSDLEIEVNWSAARPHRPSGIISRVFIENQYFDTIEKVGKKLRGTATEADTIIEGVVRQLSDKKTLSRGYRGVIYVERTDVDNGTLIKIVLHKDAYEIACDAHKSHQRITARGKLFRDAKMQNAELKNVIRFRILETKED